jgi:hypothetical protein
VDEFTVSPPTLLLIGGIVYSKLTILLIKVVKLKYKIKLLSKLLVMVESNLTLISIGKVSTISSETSKVGIAFKVVLPKNQRDSLYET